MNIISFIKERARYYNCPACARNLDGCEVRMLKQAESHLTVEVTCAQCHVTFIVVLAVQYGAEEDRDLAEEPAYVRGAPGSGEPISDDEILDVHELLEDFQGNFKELLRSPDPDAN
jgi:hypothetical protein